MQNQKESAADLQIKSIATPFEFRPFAVELALCQRYFQKSYNYNVAPGSANADGRLVAYSSDTNCACTVTYPVVMRDTPTGVLYGGNTGTINAFNTGGELTNYINTTNIFIMPTAKSVMFIACNKGGVAGFSYWHYAVSAEL